MRVNELIKILGETRVMPMLLKSRLIPDQHEQINFQRTNVLSVDVHVHLAPA